MQDKTVILLGAVILAVAGARLSGKSKSARFSHLKGWQKVFGILAVMVVLLIALNPDTLALGLFGDTAFFDLLVFMLSMQMATFATRAFHVWVGAFSKLARRLGIPSLGLRCLLGFLTLAMATVVKKVSAFLS